MTDDQRNAAFAMARELDAYSVIDFDSDFAEAATMLRTLAAEPERKPMTIEQLRALPEWWPSFEGNPTIFTLIHAVERFHGISG